MAVAANVTTIIKLQGQDRASAAVKRVTDAQRKLGKVIVKSGRASTKTGLSFGKMFGAVSAGAIAARGISAAFSALATSVTEANAAAVEFSASIGKLATLLPGQTERLVQLEGAIRSVAQASGKELGDVAEGAFQVVSAFGDAADSAEKLRVITVAAAAGGATSAEALSLVSSVTKAYGDTSAAAIQKVTDLAFMTNKLGQTTFPELAQSMGKVVPLAQALGVSQEELFGLFATLTGVTGNAAEVSTQLASAMAALLKESTGASAAIGEMGFASAEALVAEKGLVGAFKAITDHGGRSAAAIQGLFKRKEAMLAVLPLVSAQSETAAEKIDAMGKASGAAAEAHKATTKGTAALAHETKLADARLEEASVRFGKTTAGASLLWKQYKALLVETVSLQSTSDALNEVNKASIRIWNDMARSSANATVRARKETEALLRSLRNTPEGFKGGFVGAFRRMKANVLGFASDAKRAVTNSADVSSRLAAQAVGFVERVTDKTTQRIARKLDKARRDAARAARAQARDHAKLMREIEEERFDSAMDKVRRLEEAQIAASERSDQAAQRYANVEVTRFEDAMRRREALAGSTKNMQLAAAEGALKLAGALIGGERAAAPVKAAMLIAESALAMIRAYPNVPIMIGIGATAATGLAALAGIGGAGGSAPTPSGGLSSAPAPTGPAIPASGGGGGGGNVYNININGGLGTPAEVGAAINKAIGAAAGTGK